LVLVNKVRQFVAEVFEQLRLVTWPDRDTLVKLTGMVILISIAVGLLLTAADLGFTKMVEVLTMVK